MMEFAEGLERLFLADLPFRRLHELEHPDRPPLVPGAQSHPEGGRRLPLAVTGVHHDQRTVAALPGGQAVVGNDLRLSLGHVRPPFPGSWRFRRGPPRSTARPPPRPAAGTPPAGCGPAHAPTPS